MAGDVLALAAGGASFADKNAGSGKPVTVSGISIGGLDAANYTLTSTSASASADITARTLHATASALDKVYDGTTAAQFGLNDDRVAGDVLALAATNASFADKNVGNGKAVTVIGLTPVGPGRRQLRARRDARFDQRRHHPARADRQSPAANKTYDGSTAATATLGSDAVSGDLLTVNAGSASFADKNAGSGQDGHRQRHHARRQRRRQLHPGVRQRATTTADITARAPGRDGGRPEQDLRRQPRRHGHASATTASAATCWPTAPAPAFADKNVGSGKAVAVSGITLAGADAGNYMLDATTASATADITKRSLTASASGVEQDRTTAPLGASVTFSDDRVAGRPCWPTAPAPASPTRTRAAANRSPSAASPSAAPMPATTRWPRPPARHRADITRLGLNVTAVGADKVYDGSTTATATLTGANRVLGDDLRAGRRLPASPTRTPAAPRLVTVGGMTLGGADAANYVLASATASTSAAIGKRTLNATAIGTRQGV